ncbi:MAG: ATP-binding protein [Ktedonobacteraceae bacterium]|nr:ATP-binding protein [Ktedonobacteraceae bacterium]
MTAANEEFERMNQGDEGVEEFEDGWGMVEDDWEKSLPQRNNITPIESIRSVKLQDLFERRLGQLKAKDFAPRQREADYDQSEGYKVPDRPRQKQRQCPRCHYMVDDENHGYLHNPHTMKEIPCPVCSPPVRRARGRRKADRLIKALVQNCVFSDEQNLPLEAPKWTMGSYPTHGDKEAKKIVQDFIRDRIKELFLYGEPGVGKTGLAIAASQALAKQGTQTLFMPILTYVGLLREDQESRFDHTAKTHIKEICQLVEVLIIDDLGLEIPTRTTIREIQELVETRHAAGQRTLITSNMSISDLKAYWELKDVQGGFQPGSRIASRLSGWYKSYCFDGPDLRQAVQ